MEHLIDGWRKAGLEVEAAPTSSTAATGSHARSPLSGPARADEGFWVAVLPFRHRGAGLETLAEGLTEEIVTGLSRFSYLRVLSRGSTARYADGAADAAAVARETGARYVMEGSLGHAGGQLRVAVQLVDASTGAHLWAETYTRPFEPDRIFAIQDDLVPRIVSTSADHFGVLARTISDTVREKPLDQLSPYEALMRGFGYHFRLTPEEHSAARVALERAVERAPANADCWAMLSWVYSHEHAHGFNPRPGSLDRALAAARRAVDLAPSNHVAQQALAVALFFRGDVAGCRSAAERALALNPLDGSNEAIFLITFTGDWERGCGLIRWAMEQNPHHPRWYGLILAINEYRVANYRGAVDEAVKANLPDGPWKAVVLAAAHGQLGEVEAARAALRALPASEADFARSARELLEKWFDPRLVEHLMEGLSKAGLELRPRPTGARALRRSGARSGLDRGAAVRRHEPGPGPGVPLRGDGRGDHERARPRRRDPGGVARLGLPRAARGPRRCRRSPARCRWATSSTAACARPAAGCASRLSSPTWPPVSTCGPSGSTARPRTSSPCRTRSPRGWSRR